jgi:hypothetical protein
MRHALLERNTRHQICFRRWQLVTMRISTRKQQPLYNATVKQLNTTYCSSLTARLQPKNVFSRRNTLNPTTVNQSHLRNWSTHITIILFSC